MAFIWMERFARNRQTRHGAGRWIEHGLRCMLLGATLSAGAAFAATSVDLLVNQTPTPLSGPAGGTFVYKLKVSNNTSGSTANDVVLTSKLPVGAKYKSYVASGTGSCTVPAADTVITGTGDDIVCTLGSVAYGVTPTVDITVVLPTVRTWDNVASVTSATNTDPNNGNNSETKGITTTDAADLTVAAVASVGPYAAGLPYTYTVTATNSGPSPVPSDGKVEIQFRVPVGAAITSQPVGTGWTCVPASGYPLLSSATPANDTITCTRSGGLVSAASAPALTVNAVSNVQGTVTADFGVKGYKAGNVLMPDGNDNNTATVSVLFTAAGSDLTITKSRPTAQANVGVGDVVTYTLTPRLLGGTPLTGATITVTDTLGTGLTFVSASGTGWTCGVAGQVITCTRTGDAGITNYSDLRPITLQATASVTGTLGNTGSVAYSGIVGSDPVPGNNGSGNITVTSSNDANLSLTKSPSISTPVTSGTSFTYNLSVKNNGPLNVLPGQVITVTDTLPAGLEVTALSSASVAAGWVCTGLPKAGAGTFNCTYTATVSVASGATLPNLALTTVQTGNGTLTNTACPVLSGTGRVGTSTCGTNTTTTSTTNANLGVTKTVSGNVFAGENLTYTMVVTNAGPDTATRVRLNDTLASLVSTGSLQSATATNGGTCTPSGVTNTTSISLVCDLGDIALGATTTVTVVVRPNVAATGPRNNTATVTSLDINDPDRDNNTSTVSSAVTARVDITVSKTATPASVKAGEPIAFTSTVKNNGPSSAAGVTMEDEIPANTAFVGAVTASDGGVCTVVGTKISCSWVTPLPNGSQYTVSYRARPLGNQAGQTLTSRVDVSTTTDEPDKTNNFATTTNTVTPPELNVLVSITDAADPLDLGAETTYTIKVRNNGPSYGTNVVMTDVFPSTNAGGDASSATFSYQGSPTVDLGGTCTWPAVGATTGSIVCTWPGLLKDEEATVTFRMRADGLPAGAVSGTVFHRATVRVDETETDYADNQRYEGTSTRRVPINADLGITKTGPAGPLAAGATANYVITVLNNGPLDSNGAQVLDDLPAGLEFVSGAGCVYDAADRRVSCAVGALANGASRVFNLQTRLASPYTGARPLVNTAKVDALGDTVPGNNESSTTTTVQPPPPDGVSSIPTLSEWGLFLLSGLLGLLALRQVRVPRRS